MIWSYIYVINKARRAVTSSLMPNNKQDLVDLRYDICYSYRCSKDPSVGLEQLPNLARSSNALLNRPVNVPSPPVSPVGVGEVDRANRLAKNW